MFDPSMYPDDVVLSTREVAAWTSWRPRTVLSLPYLKPLDRVKTKEFQFRAGDVKEAVLGDPRPGKAAAGSPRRRAA
jgi:hypothetical protein